MFLIHLSWWGRKLESGLQCQVPEGLGVPWELKLCTHTQTCAHSHPINVRSVSEENWRERMPSSCHCCAKTQKCPCCSLPFMSSGLNKHSLGETSIAFLTFLRAHKWLQALSSTKPFLFIWVIDPAALTSLSVSATSSLSSCEVYFRKYLEAWNLAEKAQRSSWGEECVSMTPHRGLI